MNMTELAAKVAPLLGGEWSVGAKSWENWAVMRKAGEDRDFGVTLYCNPADPKGKIEIGGTMPRDKEDNEHGRVAKIGVGKTRTPYDIAREIERRFLPGYREEFAPMVIRRDNHDSYQARVAAAKQRFADLTGGKINDSEVDIPTRKDQDVGYWRRFQVSDTTVHLEMGSVPLDLAEKIVQLYMTHKKA